MTDDDLMDFLTYTWMFEEKAGEQSTDETAADCSG